MGYSAIAPSAAVVGGCTRICDIVLVKQVAGLRRYANYEGITGINRELCGSLYGEVLVVDVHVYEGLSSKVLGNHDLALDAAHCVRMIDRNEVLRTDSELNLGAYRAAPCINAGGDDLAGVQLDLALLLADFDQHAVEEVHLRGSDESCDELVPRVVIELKRSAVLLKVGLSVITER